jgi:hypothetical protein
MSSPADNPAYLHECAATARDLLNQSKDSTIRQALSDIVEGYETMARRAERFTRLAKPTRLLLLTASGWLANFADAAIY